MVLEQDILPYLQWFFGGATTFGALPKFLLVVLGLGLLSLLGGYVMAAARHGLLRGGDITYRTVSAGFRELLETSPRRGLGVGTTGNERSVAAARVGSVGGFCDHSRVRRLVFENEPSGPRQALHQLCPDRDDLFGPGNRLAIECV